MSKHFVAILVGLAAAVSVCAQTGTGNREYIVPGIDTAKGHNSRVIQSTGAVIFSSMADTSYYRLSAIAGLTSIGSTRVRIPGDTADRRLYLGVWVPLDIKLSVPGDDGPKDTIVAGPSVYAYPNPFATSVRLRLVRGNYDRADITVYDLNGREIVAVPSQDLGDVFEFFWDGRDPRGSPVATGVYTVRINAYLSGTNRLEQFTTSIVCTR
ncbi:MAG: T9SS type A sorting domain-containing protein [Candidatus Kapabacteria bacterium]|nr:T9SS type A sorting domain-containing protein [Candidatus Kapabacteria bacterium]